MDTGILSIIMNLLPWQFRGLDILSTIMFVFNLVLFIFFAFVSILRIYKHASHFKAQTLNSLEELCYLGAPVIAYLTIVAQVSLTCSKAWGYHWTILAYVLWWIALVWALAICSGTLLVLVKRQVATDRDMSPVIFLPLISLMTLGTTGGLHTNYASGMTATLAIPIIVVSYMVIGYGLFLSLIFYGLLIHRLIVVGLPPPAKLPALVIAVGPLGQFATAIQVLSTAASKRGFFGDYHQGVWLQANAAARVDAAAIMIALLVLGFGFMWIIVSWYIVVEALLKRQLPFSITWWSLIFPMGKRARQ